jgi:hypothetical protein
MSAGCESSTQERDKATDPIDLQKNKAEEELGNLLETIGAVEPEKISLYIYAC